MAKATIDVATELLREVLFLPDACEVLYAVEAKYPDTVRLVIQSPEFPEVPLGADLPRINPLMRKEMSPSTVTMIDWQIG